MTPREIVKRAALFQGPSRVPFSLPQPWGSDIKGTGCTEDNDWHPAIKTETKWEDEWGCLWEKIAGDKTMGQVKYHPLADYKNLATYRFPDYGKKGRYESARRIVGENREEKFILAGIPFSLIHRLEYLRGHNAAWTDPYLNPSELGKLLDRICEISMESIEIFSEIGADGIISCDDWGLQDRLMVNPGVWEKVWKPRYKKVYSFAREKGLITFLHSCGYITDIIDGLIDANLNVIQMDQQENMGLETLSSRFGGRICFWCPVDIQDTMTRGTEEDVKAYAKKLIDSFAIFNGGFIAKWYPSPGAAGHSFEKISAMACTFAEYGSTFYREKR